MCRVRMLSNDKMNKSDGMLVQGNKKEIQAQEDNKISAITRTKYVLSYEPFFARVRLSILCPQLGSRPARP